MYKYTITLCDGHSTTVENAPTKREARRIACGFMRAQVPAGRGFRRYHTARSAVTGSEVREARHAIYATISARITHARAWRADL